jgi:hypothetical protein
LHHSYTDRNPFTDGYDSDRYANRHLHSFTDGYSSDGYPNQYAATYLYTGKVSLKAKSK